MNKRLTLEEHAALPWLHVYAQEEWHRPAHIVGTRSALEGLRDAVDRVLSTGAEASCDGFVADGEGFRVFINVCTLGALEAMGLPYYEPLASGIDRSDKVPSK